jgi:hypothetical protein
MTDIRGTDLALKHTPDCVHTEGKPVSHHPARGFSIDYFALFIISSWVNSLSDKPALKKIFSGCLSGNSTVA